MRIITYIFTYALIIVNTLNINSQNPKYTQVRYSKECIKVINEARKELHQKLPRLIESNLNIIKKDINKKIEQKVNSLFNKEYLEKYEEANYGTFIDLYNNEQKANQIYFKTINKLNNINSDFFNYYYKNNKTLKFKDFYDLPKIKIAEEVTWYLEEAITLEEERVSRQNKDMSLSIGLSIIELIPGATAVTKVLEGVKQGGD